MELNLFGSLSQAVFFWAQSGDSPVEYLDQWSEHGDQVHPLSVCR